MHVHKAFYLCFSKTKGPQLKRFSAFRKDVYLKPLFVFSNLTPEGSGASQLENMTSGSFLQGRVQQRLN